MSKVHMNFDTGKIGKCSAKTPTNCPFNSKEYGHFPDSNSARIFFEETMNTRIFTDKKSENIVLLSDSMDIELLKDMVKNGYIDMSSHPDDDTLRILSYSRTAQYEAKWNDATKLARGLMIQTSNEDFTDSLIVERPWRKFFTLSQIETGWSLGDDEFNNSLSNENVTLDFHAKAVVTDKMDGSLGILYKDPNGEPAVSTKASFKSDQALYYTKMLRENETFYNATSDLVNNHSDTTFLFELTGRKNRIVLNYDKDNISMLGAVRKKDGYYFGTDKYSKVWQERGLDVSETIPVNNLEDALALPPRENREGVVVRILSDNPEKQLQVKIKQDDYLKMHRILTNFSAKSARAAIRDSSPTFEDYINIAKTGDVTILKEVGAEINFSEDPLYKDLQVKRKKQFEKAILPKAQKVLEVYEKVKNMPDSEFVGNTKDIMKKFATSDEMKSKIGEDMALNMKFISSRIHNTNLMNIEARGITTSAADSFDLYSDTD